MLVTGTQELDFEELAKTTEYDGGFDKDHPTVLAFWLAVADMPPEEQRRLLMFVTGSKKVRDVLFRRRFHKSRRSRHQSAMLPAKVRKSMSLSRS